MSKADATDLLLVEDVPSLANVYREFLKKAGFDVTHVSLGTDALNHIRTHLPKLVILDLQLPDMAGLDILRTLQSEDLPTAAVVITAHGSINTAVEAMQAGAADFIVKPFAAERLIVTVRNALERQRLRTLVNRFQDDMGRSRFHGFIGSSPLMQPIYRIIENAASSKATVFITGESGTGKEVCAEAIHRASPRRAKPFVAINCGAIPKDLIESEIFGHVKGAFTGATADRDGAASRADGGTLFLDELCEMDLNLQTKLLRFLQTGSFTRVGGSKVEKVDIRIVCATNRNPQIEVEEGRFREDLYYRLHVIPIHLPPLRDRDDDVIEIARALLQQYAKEESRAFEGFSPEVEATIKAYPWPGNVRQLQNVIRNVVVLNEGAQVTVEMLPPPLTPGLSALRPAVRSPTVIPTVTTVGDSPSPASLGPLWRIEKDAIERAIAACDGNIPRAAALLEVAPSTIYRKKQAWDEMVARGS